MKLINIGFGNMVCANRLVDDEDDEEEVDDDA